MTTDFMYTGFLYSYGGWCMLNGFARYALTASSVAPVCLTLAFLAYINDNYKILVSSILLAVISVVFCVFIIKQAQKYNPVTLKNLESASPADKDTGVSFVLLSTKPLTNAKIKGLRVKKLTEHTYMIV